ncbi:MAG: hypothetical protein ACRC7H_08905, partial [Plesiomonas shigelloides]
MKPSESQPRERLDEEDHSRPDSRSAPPESQLYHSPARWSVTDKCEYSADEWRRECSILEREREDLLASIEELKIQNEQLRARAEPSNSRSEPRTVAARDRLYREGLEYGGASTQYKSVYFRDRETPPQRSSDRRQDYRETTRYDSPSPKRSPEPVLRHGDQTLETYAVLDDGSEHTLLLQPAVQQLGLEGQPEDLPLRTVRQELQKLHGAAVSFSISPACSPAIVYNIQGAFTAPKLGLGQHTYP